MKVKSIFAIMVFIACMAQVFAESYTEEYNVDQSLDTTSLQIEMLKYDPFPVNPGEYFDLWILLYKTGTGSDNVDFELLPEYPFSIDSNEEADRSIDGMTGESALLEYKVRVSDDAVEGENQLQFRYRLNNGVWIEKEFDISVEDAQTTFDGVIQDIEDSSISLALANTGKNVASSVIVSVPSQDEYTAVGTSGQMVGDLDNGDYTIVSFEVESTGPESDTITFQIDYTDDIGERRSVLLELPLDLRSGTSLSAENISELGGMPGGSYGSRGSSSYMKYVWIAVGLFVLIVLFKFRKKIKHLFSKKKKNLDKKPEWMKK